MGPSSSQAVESGCKFSPLKSFEEDNRSSMLGTPVLEVHRGIFWFLTIVGSIPSIWWEVEMDATPLVVHGVLHPIVVPHKFFMTLMDILSVGRK